MKMHIKYFWLAMLLGEATACYAQSSNTNWRYYPYIPYAFAVNTLTVTGIQDKIPKYLFTVSASAVRQKEIFNLAGEIQRGKTASPALLAISALSALPPDVKGATFYYRGKIASSKGTYYWSLYDATKTFIGVLAARRTTTPTFPTAGAVVDEDLDLLEDTWELALPKPSGVTAANTLATYHGAQILGSDVFTLAQLYKEGWAGGSSNRATFIGNLSETQTLGYDFTRFQTLKVGTDTKYSYTYDQAGNITAATVTTP